MKPPDCHRLIHIYFILGFSLWVLVSAFMGGGRGVQTPEARAEGSAGGAERADGALKRQKGRDMADTNQLTEEEGRQLLTVARKTIEAALFGRKTDEAPDSVASRKFLERRGTFVTLTIGHNLRGCIGHIIPQETLFEGIKVNAVNAAFQDPRFSPLSKKEWDRVKIEISVLTDPEELPYEDAQDLLNKLRAGLDGVIIKQGYNQATFLPQVWEQLPKKEEFLGHLCMKAGLDREAWKKEKLEVSTYQVQAFEE